MHNWTIIYREGTCLHVQSFAQTDLRREANKAATWMCMRAGCPALLVMSRLHSRVVVVFNSVCQKHARPSAVFMGTSDYNGMGTQEMMLPCWHLVCTCMPTMPGVSDAKNPIHSCTLLIPVHPGTRPHAILNCLWYPRLRNYCPMTGVSCRRPQGQQPERRDFGWTSRERRAMKPALFAAFLYICNVIELLPKTLKCPF